MQVELAWHNNTIPFKAPSSARWNLAVALKLLTLDLIANSFYGRVILKYSGLFVVLQWYCLRFFFFFFVRIRNPITLKQETIFARATHKQFRVHLWRHKWNKKKTKTKKKVKFYKLFHAISDRTFFQLIEAFSPQRLLSLHPALIFT